MAVINLGETLYITERELSLEATQAVLAGVVTGDPEFRQVEGEVAIRWLPRG